MSLKDRYFVRPVYGEHVRRFIVQYHYAQRCPCIQHAFGVFQKVEKKIVGVMSFGQSPNAKLQADCPWPILELNRIALIHNEKNLVTWWMSHCFQQLPKPTLLVSWADRNQGHVGYVYQAANWIYTGLSQVTPEVLVAGRKKHHRCLTKENVKREKRKISIQLLQALPKYRYFYPLGSKTQKRRMQKYISERFGIFPYPKGESIRYDMSEERVKKEALEKVRNKLL